MSDIYGRFLAEEAARQTANELKEQAPQPEVDEATAATIGETAFGPDFVKELFEDPDYQALQAKADAEIERGHEKLQ